MCVFVCITFESPSVCLGSCGDSVQFSTITLPLGINLIDEELSRCWLLHLLQMACTQTQLVRLKKERRKKEVRNAKKRSVGCYDECCVCSGGLVATLGSSRAPWCPIAE